MERICRHKIVKDTTNQWYNLFSILVIFLTFSLSSFISFLPAIKFSKTLAGNTLVGHSEGACKQKVYQVDTSEITSLFDSIVVFFLLIRQYQ